MQVMIFHWQILSIFVLLIFLVDNFAVMLTTQVKNAPFNKFSKSETQS